MPLEYPLGRVERVLFARASGVVTEREVIDATDSIVRRTSGEALHVDVLTRLDRGTSLDQLDVEALKRIHAHIQALFRDNPEVDVKSAFVTGDVANAGVLRLWKALVDLCPTIGRHVQVFRNEAGALAWLEQPRT